MRSFKGEMKLTGYDEARMFEDFPPFFLQRLDCCGLVEVSSSNFDIYTKPRFEKWLSNSPDITNEGTWTTGMLIATSVPHQRGWINWLKRMGFVKKESFYNHNSDNKVTMYFYKLPKWKVEKGEEEVAF